MYNYSKAVIERVFWHADIFVNECSTIRKVANQSGFCKSTVHRDLTTILPKIDSVLAEKVREIIAVNVDERAHRGGAVTKAKYENAKKCQGN